MVLDGHLQQEANLEEDAEEIRPKGKYIHKQPLHTIAGAVFFYKIASVKLFQNHMLRFGVTVFDHVHATA